MRTSNPALHRRLAVAGIAVSLGLSGGTATAVTIDGDFRSAGESFDVFGGRAESAPATAGGGSLTGVFDAAAGVWETAIQDDATYSVNYGWDDLGGNTLGQATRYTNRQNRDARIVFDNSGTDWFADPTPNDNSEFGDYRESSRDLGGGEVNTGRVYNSASGDAARRIDLLSVATHELGHALGFLNVGGSITVGDSLPKSGTRIDAIGGHTDPNALPDTLMAPTTSPGERTLVSAVDILGTAQVNGFSNVDLDPSGGGDDGGGGGDDGNGLSPWERFLAQFFPQFFPQYASGGFDSGNTTHATVPTPGSLALLGAGLLGLAGMRRRSAVAG